MCRGCADRQSHPLNPPALSCDDDGNGWVDDIYGWHVGAETGQVTPGWHGTNVAGLAAARGGNGIGVSGVAALVRQMRPELSADEVARAIRNGVHAEFVEPWSQSMGYLNAVGALSARADVDVLMPPLGDDPMQSSVVRCAPLGHW